MQCHDVQQMLDDYSCDLLPEQERRRVEGHLATCQACAREATALVAFNDKVESGLKDWVDQGTCPPDVAMRIEAAIMAESLTRRPANKKPSFWQSWPVRLGTVAAAAAIVVVGATRPEVSAHLAGLPVVGGLAARMIEYDLEYTAVSGRPVGASLLSKGKAESIGKSITEAGITLHVEKVQRGNDSTKIYYTLAGVQVEQGASPEHYRPVLQGTHGEISLRSFRGVQQQDKVSFTAEFAVLPVGPFTFRLPTLPVPSAAKLEWAGDAAGNLSMGVNESGHDVRVSAIYRAGAETVVTVSWADTQTNGGTLVRLTGWEAVGADGRAYTVRLEGAPVKLDGMWSQQVRINLSGTELQTLRATRLERLTSGGWEIEHR